MLLAAGAVWGTYPVVLRALYAAPGPSLPPIFIVAVRFQLTSLIFTAFKGLSGRLARDGDTDEATATESARLEPPTPSRQRRRTATVAASVTEAAPLPAGLQRAAAELAVLGLIGNFLSVFGLSQVAGVLAETLLGCVHIFVPLLTVALGGSAAVGLRTWQACAVSFIAVLVASGAVGGGAVGGGVAATSVGLAALVGAAGLYSLARVRTQHHVGVSKLHSLDLNRQRVCNMGILATLALAGDALRFDGASRAILAALPLITPTQWALIVLSCIASGFLGSSLQYQGLKTLPAASSQPFFALQPLFACVWTWLFLSEPIAPSYLTGGALMVGGALLASTDGCTVEETIDC